MKILLVIILAPLALLVRLAALLPARRKSLTFLRPGGAGPVRFGTATVLLARDMELFRRPI